MAGMMGFGANHLGIGERPSESHHWVPGMGWVFVPTYEEGSSLAEQSAKQEGSAPWAPEVSGASVVDASNAGVDNFYVGEGGGNLTSADIRARQSSHDWYTRGMDLFKDAYHQNSAGYAGASNGFNDQEWRDKALAFRDTLFEPGQNAGQNQYATSGPWTNTFETDIEHTYNQMQKDNYNAFLGSEGGWVGDDKRIAGNSEGYTDESIAGYLKNAFSGADMVKHRGDALKALEEWRFVRGEQGNLEDGPGRHINTGTQRMNRRIFDELGLADRFGMEWVEPESQASKMLNGTAEGGASRAANMLNAGYNGGGGSQGGGNAAQRLAGGLMSGGGDAMRDVIYGKAQEKIFGE
jgi:hypothetical protein